MTDVRRGVYRSLPSDQTKESGSKKEKKRFLSLYCFGVKRKKREEVALRCTSLIKLNNRDRTETGEKVIVTTLNI